MLCNERGCTYLQYPPRQSRSRRAKTSLNWHSLYGHDTSWCTHCSSCPTIYKPKAHAKLEKFRARRIGAISLTERWCRDCRSQDSHRKGGSPGCEHFSCVHRTLSCCRNCSDPISWWCRSRRLSIHNHLSWWSGRIQPENGDRRETGRLNKITRHY